ncbi:ATP-binding protein [Bradyrhizobium sp.]
MKQPIPDAALDDRLGFVGTAGSGKSYNAMGRIERLLQKHARICCVDPLGVFWGLRLMPDGKTPSGFNIPIFGGPHGDLPLTEHSGALIGETVAGMAESCIIDLSEIGTKAGERRFMLHFLTALYRKSKDEPLHLVIDEADMFAPQKLTDKDGEAAKLLGMMETVVRRGRIKGFIPWLITQRPAVIAKDVLSQVDGLVAFKLTSSQDRDALSAWVEGSAEKEDWKTMRAALPAMERGQGVVWIPGRGIMETVSFPEKMTFDSSRTPKRGEKKSTASLKPLDLGSLKDRLAKIDADRKADDPKTLRSEIAALRKELTSKSQITQNPAPDPKAIESARTEGYDRGLAEGLNRGENRAKAALASVTDRIKDALAIAEAATEALDSPAPPPAPRARPAPVAVPARPVPRPAPRPQANGRAPTGIGRSEQKIVDAIRWWNVLGIPAPSHAQAAFIAGYSHKSGTWATYLSRLRSAGMIEGRGDLALTESGLNEANEPDALPTREALWNAVLGKIDAPLQRILKPIIAEYPDALSHAAAADEAGYSPSSGTWATYLSRLRSLDLIEGRGELKAQGWLFP